MTTTSPSSSTQERVNYLSGLRTLDASSTPNTGSFDPWSNNRHHDADSVSSLASAASSTTRRDDEHRYRHHNTVSSSNILHVNKQLSHSAPLSQYSGTWPVQNEGGILVNLPRHPYSWSPSELASYLATELHADGTPLDSDTIRAMEEFIQDFKISGRVFLSLDQDDFRKDRRLEDLHPFWCKAMWDAAYDLRKRAVPYKRSRASNIVVKHEKAPSIMNIFKSNSGRGADDTNKTDLKIDFTTSQKRSLSRTSEIRPKRREERKEVKTQSSSNSFGVDPGSSVSQANSDFPHLPLESHSEVCEVKQPGFAFVPELVPVLPLSPTTPTDVILLNEVPDIPNIPDSTSFARRGPISSVEKPFTVFQEPEDAPDEDLIPPDKDLDLVSMPVPQERNEYLPGLFSKLSEDSPTCSKIIGTTEGQPSLQDLTSRLLTVVSDKDAPLNIIASAGLDPLFSAENTELTQKNLTNWEPDCIQHQTDIQEETLHSIKVLRTRLSELECRLKMMEKGSRTRLKEQQMQQHVMRSFDDFDDDIKYNIHCPPILKNRTITDIALQNVADTRVTRSWQNALILLAGATTGVSVVLLPGLLRHIWSRL